ncbi:zinc ribbon domain-containing protein [Clostridium sp. Marseille-P299]|uniref:zinc ribbon domain-containing protein n=1 Tax=Clostridium sp. Marseille-P299 TaxID=1805477 RepID=UPI00082BA884|nr:zinc ribbon domain-containing protein [Clostridium sp. Marseille-P299]
MQNNLSKQNFGIPVTILCAIAYGLCYAASSQLSWALLVFLGIVYVFSFDEEVKSALKQGILLAFFWFIIDKLFWILKEFIGWFVPTASSYSSVWEEALGVGSKVSAGTVIVRIIDYISSGIDFAFIVVFVLLIFNSLKGKYIRLDFINKIIGTEKVKCSQCGAELEEASTFCTKCGNKIK